MCKKGSPNRGWNLNLRAESFLRRTRAHLWQSSHVPEISFIGQHSEGWSWEAESADTVPPFISDGNILHKETGQRQSLTEGFFLFQNILFYEKEIPVIYMLKMNLELLKMWS